MRRLNKKGFAYVLVVSLLLVVLVAIFMSSNRYKLQDRQEALQIRILSINDFVKNMNNDIHRASYISAFRSLIALENQISVSGIFLNDTKESFRETFFYGTVNNTNVTIMENSSFNDYLNRVKQVSANTGINLDVNVTKINLTQSDPWSVNVHVFTDINVTDVDNVVSFVYSNEYVTNVPIADLRDPLYGVFSENKVPNTIRAFNKTQLVFNNETTNLTDLVNGSYYVASNLSPNFIMRFENNVSPSEFGIESIVNVNMLSGQDLDVYPNRVKVDYIYFNDLPRTDTRCVPTDTDLSDLKFIITTDRLQLYEVDELNYSTSCP